MIAFDICLQLGYPHPDVLLSSITHRQWTEWLQYIEQRGIIGTHRDDIRSEAMQQRMVAKLFDAKGEVPQPVWPYWNGTDAAEIIANARNTDDNLVPKEGGGYEWRQPLEP